MVVYIAGINELEAREAENLLESVGNKVVNPNKMPAVFSESTKMDIRLHMVKECEAVVLLKGYAEDKTAMIESQYALLFDKMLFDYEAFKADYYKDKN